MTTICVDVMGADKEPEVLLEGVTRALEKDPDLCVLLAGSADVVEPYCASHERARALVTTEVIGMAEHPASAVRGCPGRLRRARGASVQRKRGH